MAATVMSPQSDAEVKAEPKPTLTPPASEEADKQDDSGSELSDLELEPEDNSEIEPDHYYEGGKIPVFKPVSRGKLLWYFCRGYRQKHCICNIETTCYTALASR